MNVWSSDLARPDKLYKYRSINDFTEDIFINHRIYCTSPKHFNDPFECRPHWATYDPDTPDGKQRFKRYVQALGVRQVSKKLALKQQFRHAYAHPDIEQDLGFRAMSENWGIYSMSENPADLLMWPHYADSHRGICLEFRTSFPPFNWNLWPVFYSDVYPVIDVENLADAGGALREMMLTKSVEWAYEKEWRLLLRKMNSWDFKYLERRPVEIRQSFEQQHGPGFYGFPVEALSSVIFGLRTPAKDMKTVLNWIQRGKLNPKILYAKQDRTRFRINCLPEA